MRYKFTLLSLCCFSFSFFTLSAQIAPIEKYSPMRSQGTFLGNISPLRDLPSQPTPTPPPAAKLWHKPNYFGFNALNGTDPLPRNGDPLAKIGNTNANDASTPILTPGLSIEGLNENSVDPPDPSGDVGKNHYVQMINAGGGSWFRVWNKQGNSVLGPIHTSTIWSQVGSGSVGDPIIQYDQGAERWVMMEMQGANELLLAISDDSDPTGSWKAYRFATLGFPDYPKLYIWPDAYYVTVNEGVNGGQFCSGYALDRSAILSGADDFQVYRFVFPTYLGIVYQPATGVDWEGSTPPPPGTPGYIFRVYDDSWNGGTDQLQYWEINVNWNDIGQSFIEGPKQLFPAPFETRVCWSGLFNCIEQPGNAGRITALENIIMFRIPYRNYGSFESIVLNHISDVSSEVGPGGDAAVRWYELRRTPGSNWSIYQQGTYAPDLTNRFMGTICTDEIGNIGLGYSVASTSVNPGIRLTGRRAGDPLNEMTIQEYTLKAGEGTHSTQRWGDYSSMAVDPEDGRTFWFTGEYQPGQGLHGTRIGTFTIQRDSHDVTPQALLSPALEGLYGTQENIQVELFNSGLLPASGVPLELIFEGQSVVTDPVPGTLAAGESVQHTFSATVAMPIPGKHYAMAIVSHWAQDDFNRNDTLLLDLHRATENDAAAAGRINMPGLVCSANHEMGFILQNASGLPLNQATIRYRVNLQNWTEIPWVGNLMAGQRDTIPLMLTGIQNGVNSLRVITSQPNGVQDQNISNDSMFVKFYGNLDGTYVDALATTQFGNLHWEVRDQSNALINQGLMTSGTQSAQICSINSSCYKLIVRSTTFSWAGIFQLLDLYGNVLIEVNYATPESQIFEFCTPERKNQDVGARQLIAPISSGSLQADESVRILVRNFGLQSASNINVGWQLDGGAWHQELVPGPLGPGEDLIYTFAVTADLSAPGNSFLFRYNANIVNDEDASNNERESIVWHQIERDAAINSFSPFDACTHPNDIYGNLSFLNNGLDTLHQLITELDLNGLLQIDTFKNLEILPGASYTDLLFLPSAQIGTNTLEIRIIGVDGAGPDNFAPNDTLVFHFEIHPSSAAYGYALSLDEYPQQTRWELHNASGTVLFSGGPYLNAFDFITGEWCLQPDSCYSFHLFDAGSNGFNGQFSTFLNGIFQWTTDGEIFNAEFVKNFCAPNACANLGLQATLTPETNDGTADGSIHLSASGGTPPYTFSLDNQNYQSNSLISGLSGGDYTVTCRDSLYCMVSLMVHLGTSATHQTQESIKLRLNPNPCSDMVQVQLPAANNAQYLNVELFNENGKLLHTNRLARWDTIWNGALALSTYPSGIYWVRVRTPEKIYLERLVKQ